MGHEQKAEVIKTHLAGDFHTSPLGRHFGQLSALVALPAQRHPTRPRQHKLCNWQKQKTSSRIEVWSPGSDGRQRSPQRHRRPLCRATAPQAESVQPPAITNQTRKRSKHNGSVAMSLYRFAFPEVDHGNRAAVFARQIAPTTLQAQKIHPVS